MFNSRSLVFQDLSRMLRLFAVSTSREVARLTFNRARVPSSDLFFFRQNWEMKSKSSVCDDAACGRQRIVGRSAHLWSSPCRRFAGPYFLFDGRQQSRLMVDSRIFVSEGAAAGFSFFFAPRVSFSSPNVFYGRPNWDQSNHMRRKHLSATRLFLEYICISPSNILVQARSRCPNDGMGQPGWSRMGGLMDGRVERVERRFAMDDEHRRRRRGGSSRSSRAALMALTLSVPLDHAGAFSPARGDSVPTPSAFVASSRVNNVSTTSQSRFVRRRTSQSSPSSPTAMQSTLTSASVEDLLDRWYDDSSSIKCPFFRRRVADAIDDCSMLLQFLIIRHKSLPFVSDLLLGGDGVDGRTAAREQQAFTAPGCKPLGRHIKRSADGSAQKTRGLSIGEVQERIRNDWLGGSSGEVGYYITGRLDSTIYRDDCLFSGPDPDMPVKGEFPVVNGTLLPPPSNHSGGLTFLSKKVCESTSVPRRSCSTRGRAAPSSSRSSPTGTRASSRSRGGSAA